MSFVSVLFLMFFAVLVVAYWSTKQEWRWLLLAGASYYFYFSWQPFFAVLIGLVTLLTYSVALAMEYWPQRKKLSLVAGIGILFSILFFYKYLGFASLTLTEILSWFEITLRIPTFSLLLPLGISFYTFQSVGYLFDVYRGTCKAERHFGKLAVFTAFFPLAGSGPIERSTTLLPQIDVAKKFSYAQTVSGLQLFTYGLFKKLVIADNLGTVVDRVFDNLPEYKGLSLIVTMIFFSWQIYADFSGYTDMARGVGRMLGFNLLENFRWPYLATSVGDFWRRWHISLSSWLRDYLYIPLGGSRQGMVRTLLNTLVVFVLCGLWHGPTWTFVVWGVLHGVVISGERLVKQYMPFKVSVPALMMILYTNSLIGISWVFFRATSFADALYILRNAPVGIKNFVLPSYIWATLSQMYKTNVVEMLIGLSCLAIIISLELLSSKVALGKLIRRQPTMVRWFIYTSVVATIILFRKADIVQFMYVQF
jgi:D-alanyl-lipoteichoic acid acyltransferase DltB (MBOAT superfamily)